MEDARIKSYLSGVTDMNNSLAALSDAAQDEDIDGMNDSLADAEAAARERSTPLQPISARRRRAAVSPGAGACSSMPAR